MSVLAVAAREGTRLVRASPARSAIISVAIAGATVLGAHAGAVAVSCSAFSIAVVVVARRSPRPERLMSANAWSRAGASRFAIWLSGVIEVLILAWTGALVGGVVGAMLSQATATHATFGHGLSFVRWQLGALGLAACLPTSRLRAAQPTPARSVESGAAMAARVATVAIALPLMLAAATRVRTDWDLWWAGLFIVSLLVIVGLIAAGPASNWLIDRLGTFSIWRSIGAIVARRRTPATVRFVIVAAVTLATVFAILGASVQARPDTARVLSERVARLPVLPRNVALVRLDPVRGGSDLSPLSAGFTPTGLTRLRTAVAGLAPGAETIELRALGEKVSGKAFGCTVCDLGPFVIEDPRLRSVYGTDAKYPASVSFGVGLLTSLRKPDLSQVASTRVPSTDAIVEDLRRGRPLPTASFAGVEYDEVPAKDAVGLPTAVSAMFIRAPKPFTNVQLARLTAAAGALRATTQPRLTLIGPHGTLVPHGARLTPVTLSPSLREASWAATSAAARWAWAGVAALLALATLLVTLTIDTIDRRRDVERLERIGATPHQIRAAASAYAAVVLATIAWLSTLLVVALVKLGTTTFNRAEPAISVPFTMPWAVVLFLTLGLPAVGAGLAALVARPAGPERRSR